MPFGIASADRTVEIFRRHRKRDEPAVFQRPINVAGDAAAEPYLRFIKPGQQSTFVLQAMQLVKASWPNGDPGRAVSRRVAPVRRLGDQVRSTVTMASRAIVRSVRHVLVQPSRWRRPFP